MIYLIAGEAVQEILRKSLRIVSAVVAVVRGTQWPHTDCGHFCWVRLIA